MGLLFDPLRAPFGHLPGGAFRYPA